MKIQIATRLKPFSHSPGSACIIPGTECKLEAYPTLLKIGEEEFPIPVTGPIDNFTLELDLEHNCVFVFGRAKEGFYRLKISASSEGFEIFVDKMPQGLLKIKERIFLKKNLPFFLPTHWERLSLGSQKAQDWDLVWRRFDLAEILPHLYGLGQKIPTIAPENRQKIENLSLFCRAAFSKLLVPRLKDEDHLGLHYSIDPHLRPSSLLISAKEFIRALFFQQKDSHLFLLPHLMYPCGKMLEVQAKEIGELDIEWTKNLLRKVILRAKKGGEIFLHLQKGVSSYRLRSSLREKGKRKKGGESFFVEAGKTYYLDKFQK